MWENCHLLANEVVEENLPLVLPRVRGEGKAVKGARVDVDCRPVADYLVQLGVEKVGRDHLVRISTLESSIGVGAEIEACRACGAGFVSSWER